MHFNIYLYISVTNYLLIRSFSQLLCY